MIRQSFTPIDLESRLWLCESMREAGLDARIDGVGTVFGRSPKPGPALLIGSHTDTQPEAGELFITTDAGSSNGYRCGSQSKGRPGSR